MASGRFLSAAVSEDFRLNSLSLEAQLVYLMAIPHLDVDGIMSGHPTLVHAKACPLKTDLRERMPAIIDEWVTVGLVVRYECDDEDALFFTGFAKNQKVRRDREGKSRFDLPPGWTRDDSGTPLREDSRRTPGVLQANSGLKQSKLIQQQQQDAPELSGENSSSGGGGGECDIAPAIEAWVEYEMTPKATKQTQQRLREDMAQHGAAYVLECIRISADAGQPTMRYYRGVLRKGPDSPRASPNGASPYTGITVIRDEGDDDG